MANNKHTQDLEVALTNKCEEIAALRAKLDEAEREYAKLHTAMLSCGKVELIVHNAKLMRHEAVVECGRLQQRLDAATARVKALEEALKYYGGEDGVCINDGGKRAKAAPRMIDGAWWVECADVGTVPASRVEVQP